MEQKEYYDSRLMALQKAIKGLSESLELHAENFDPILSDLIKCGHVQKFEYCAELLWKTIKLWLVRQEFIDVNSPKAVIKTFYQAAEISDHLYQQLLLVIHHRNLYSHVYNQNEFEKLYKLLSQHTNTIKEAIHVLEQKE